MIAALAGATTPRSCGSIEEAVSAAEEALLLVDLAEPRAALARAEAILGCGWLDDPAWLARFWLIEGSLASIEGDDEGLRESFLAAHHASPETWIEGLGTPLRQRLDDLVATPAGEGRLIVRGVEPGYRVQLNGAPASLPLDVPAGLQLIQIGTDRVRFSQMLYVLPNTVTALEPSLPLLPPQLPGRSGPPAIPPGESAPGPISAEAPPIQRSLELFAALGIVGSLGRALSWESAPGLTVHEPEQKLRIPLEGGLVFRSGAGWIRGAVSLAPLIDGELRYLGQEVRAALPWFAETALAGGGTVGPLDLGAHAGVLWPRRVSTRAIGGLRIADTPLRIEARLGIDLHPEGGPEPAAGLFTTLSPWLVR